MRRILVVGRSHIYAMRKAAGLREDRGRLAVLRWNEDEPGGERFSSTEEVQALALALNADDVFAISYLGMNHVALGLFRQSEPFGFFGDEAAPREGETVIPRNVLDDALGRFSTKWRMFHSLIKRVRAKVVFISVPPPKEDNAYISERAATALGAAGKVIADPHDRLRMWRAERELVARMASNYRALFLDPPEAAMTSCGFLRPEFYEDGTHANAAYGDLVLEQLLAITSPAPLAPPQKSWAYRRWRKIRAHCVARIRAG